MRVAFDFRVFYVRCRGGSPWRDDLSAGRRSDAPGRARVRLPAAPRRARSPLTLLPDGGGGAPRHGAARRSPPSRSRSCSAFATGAARRSCSLWPPVISAIQTGNVTLPLALAAALVWRYRDRAVVPGAGARYRARGEVLPLAARRLARGRAATRSGRLGGGVVGVGPRARFLGRDRLRRASATTRASCAGSATSWTIAVQRVRRCFSTSGAPSTAARAVWIAVARRGCSRRSSSSARRGDERTCVHPRDRRVARVHRRSSGCTTSRCSSSSSRSRSRRLGIVWFVPLGLFVTPGSGHPTPFQTTATFTIAALTIVLALRASLGLAATAREPVSVAPPPRARAEAA